MVNNPIVPIPPYGMEMLPIPQVTPFTMRDSLTYLRRFERLVAWINRELIPNLNSQMNDLGEEFENEVNELIALVNAAVDSIINSSVEVQDAVVAGIFNDVASQTRVVTDALYAKASDVSELSDIIADINNTLDTRLSDATLESSYAAIRQYSDDRSAVNATVQYKEGVAASGSPYSMIVTRVHTHGKFVKNLVRKEYGGVNYEDSGNSGSSFIPPRDDLKTFKNRHGGQIVINASGWRTSGNIGEIRGAQIKDGVIYHDFVNSGSAQDIAALGYRKDGSFKTYYMWDGDTAASMVADGVIHSWCWGPPVVKNGVRYPFETDAHWSALDQVQVSGRQVVGQDESGDIIIVTIYGTTGTSGVKVGDLGAIVLAEGMYNGLILDGGGSAQTLISGAYANVSSDDGGTRPVADVMIIDVPVEEFDTGWINLTYPVDMVQNTIQMQIRQIGSEIACRGDVKQASGLVFDGATSYTLSNVPERFRNKGVAALSYPAACNGSTFRKIAVLGDGSINIVGDSAIDLDAAYTTVNNLKWDNLA